MLISSETVHASETNESFAPAFAPPTRFVKPGINILLVEDTASDALLLRLALDASLIPYRLHNLRKGNEVIPWLYDTLKGGPGALPDMIMLDLGLPYVDGFEILAEIAAGIHAIRAIPIVILTGDGNFSYLKETYALSIMEYLIKPCDTYSVMQLLRRVQRLSLS